MNFSAGDLSLRLIVLAAGRGRRLEHLTDDRPKCLVELGDGSSLLSRLLRQASLSERVDEVVVCAGYRSEAVEAEANSWTGVLPTSVRLNPWFAESGPIVSLWVVRDLLAADDFMVCNGDTYYSSEVFEAVTDGAGNGIRIAVDAERVNAPDGMRVAFREDGALRAVGKDIPLPEAGAVSAGLVAVLGESARLTFLDAMSSNVRGADGAWCKRPWHSLLNQLREVHEAIATPRVPSGSWWEVDTARDLQLLRERIAQRDGVATQGR